MLFRLLQGAFGAGLVPLSQAVLLDIYPREQHGRAMAIWGVGVMVGPILGPTLGGWLTEYYNWRWVFYINLPFGILALLGLLAFVPETRRDSSRRFDFFGFALLSLALGALQLMLDRGETKDWFASTEIIVEAVICGLCFYLFLVHMLTAKRPFIEPALFKDRNFATGLLFIFVVGIILLATLSLLPPFLQNLMGYPVLTTGYLLAPRGVGTMVAMFMVGFLTGRLDVRLLILIGLGLTALSLWQMAGFTADVSSRAIVESGLIQGLGLGFMFVPLSTVAFATLAPERRTEATAMFSLMRNIGSSIGISVVVSLLAQNTQINHATPRRARDALQPDLPDPQHRRTSGASTARRASWRSTTRSPSQAATIAYVDDFRLMMYVMLLAIPMLLLLRSPRRQRAATAAMAAAE